MELRRVKGTRDILPAEYNLRENLLKKATHILRAYGFNFIMTPTFEYTDLFVKSIGETTDIVEKEMYTFKDRGGRSLTLRPEGTAPIVRAVIENRLKPPLKLAYYMNMFRAERPQKGRFREFWQLGVEVIGPSDPLADADLLELAHTLLKELGLENFTLELNSIGTIEDRERYKKVLLSYLEGIKDELCDDCKRRMIRNPLRVLDCKIDAPKLSNAPKILDHLSEESKRHFEEVLGYLDRWKIPYRINPYMVRGLDYYTRTTFEFKVGTLGAQDTVLGGGRYDGLFEYMGGPPTPALGFAMGIERFILAIEQEGQSLRPHYFIAYITDEDRDYAVELMRKLRGKGITVEMTYDRKSLRKQLKLANSMGARYALIIGEDERRMGKVRRRDMESGEEILLSPDELSEN